MSIFELYDAMKNNAENLSPQEKVDELLEQFKEVKGILDGFSETLNEIIIGNSNEGFLPKTHTITQIEEIQRKMSKASTILEGLKHRIDEESKNIP